MGHGPLSVFHVFCLSVQTLWQQNYDPAGNIWLSALIALIPIVFLSGPDQAAAQGYQAGTVTVLLALGVALLFYKMPVSAALASAVYGFFYGPGSSPGSLWRPCFCTSCRSRRAV